MVKIYPKVINVYIYTCIYIYIYIAKHDAADLQPRLRTHAYMNTCMHNIGESSKPNRSENTRTHMCVCVYIYIHTHACTASDPAAPEIMVPGTTGHRT